MLEAHTLPFAQGFFDALLSFDAYHYFGTDDLYLGYVSQFVRPGGSLGIVVPGVLSELNGEVPCSSDCVLAMGLVRASTVRSGGNSTGTRPGWLM